MNPVLSAAQSAYEHTSFYKRLYGERPTSLEEIPFTSSTQYHRAEGTLECINPSVDPCGVLPPFHREFRRLPHTILESEPDIDQRQERLGEALEDIGICGGEPKRMLIVTTEENGPFACDLSTGLGWEGHPASIFYWNGKKADLEFQIDAHQPDRLIWCLQADPHETTNFPAQQILTIHCINQPLPEWPGPLWIFCDEVNLIGSRPTGRSTFRVNQQQLRIEPGLSGRPSLTTLQRELFPLIRYELPNAFEVLHEL